MSTSETIEHFLATGQVDPSFRAWDGSLRERRARGTEVLDQVLRRVVRWRARRAPLRPTPAPADVATALRERLGPIAHGLLSPRAAAAFLDVLPDRVQVVTVDAFLAGIDGASLELRWTLANMLLDDMGAPPLADDAPQLDGFCEDGRAWLTARAFQQGGDWADPLVHECVHLLHEPGVLGPGAPPLLSLPGERCETLAYACELWACIQRQPDDPAVLVARFARARPVADPRIDHRELVAILHAASDAPGDAWRLIAAAAQDPGERAAK
ncbi:MAG: hypothetical protein H6742_11660 [Alphaproteobacteria bacterium]|nr:hypothetical protein [Alphaproteobacteria bacterium]